MGGQAINIDFTYCTGLNCPIKTLCKRYFYTDSSIRMYWMMEVEFDAKIDRGINFIDKDK